jgi:plastocyanin
VNGLAPSLVSSFLALGLLVAAAAPAPYVHRPAVYTITIKDLAFGPSPSGIRVGDTVEWVNNDILLHSVTAQDKSFDSDIAPDAKLGIVMEKAGVIAYYCKYHPGMKGQLNVAK